MSFTSNLNTRLTSISNKISGLPADPADASDILGLINALDTLIDGAITKVDTIDGIVDTISTAVVTTIPGTISSLDTLIDGAITKIDTIDGIVDTISTAVVTTIPDTISSLDTLIDGAITNIGETIDGIIDIVSTALVTAIPADLTIIKAALALTGDSVVGDVLTGKTFYKDNAQTKLTGTMPNNAGAVACVSASITAGTTLSVIPAAGYTDGSDDTSTVDLTTVDADLVTGNIKAGVTILGVAGKTEVVDTEILVDAAIAANITLGKKAYVNGVLIVGTLV
jgi:hypothetical protein